MVALFGAIAAAGTLSALWSLVQFVLKYRRAAALGEDFYVSYVAARTTGFMSHWQTFAGEMMFVFLILMAAALFVAAGKWRWIALGAATMVGVAVVLNFTRGVWPALGAGFVYLVWCWRRVFLLALPVVAAVLLLAAPEPVGRRIRSAWNPDPKLDSNLHRDVLRRTGWRMIAAHPLLGVGPEHVKRRFAEFMPEDAPRPIPSNWYYDHLHNTYAHYGAERGIPALLAFLALIGLAIWDLGRAAWRTGDARRRFLLHAVVASLIGILVGGWWEVNVGDSEVLGTMAAMAGAGYAARDEAPHA
jgi:O-antigen ligase